MNKKSGIFLGVAIFGLLLVSTSHLLRSRGPMNKTIRMAIVFNQSARSLDPASILTAYQYELIRNMYGRLVEYNSKAQLVAGVPDSFSWKDDEVTFVFGKKATTADGFTITAQDAELSLKRLIIKGKSGHGDIRRFLCPDFKLTSLQESCPGIKSEDDKLTLKVVNPTYLPLLLATLESADYSIIPSSAIDQADPGLQIKDYRNTSGPYYLSKDSESDSLILRANPYHYHFNELMPQEVQLVPVDLQGGIGAFKRGEVDLLPTSQSFTGPDAKDLLNPDDNEVHETLPLKVRVARFSPRALRDFTPEQRVFAALVTGEAMTKILPHAGGQPTVQFFQALSDGALSDEQVKAVRDARATKSIPPFPRPIEIRLLPKYADAFAEALKDYPDIQVTRSEKSVFTLAPEERPDLYFVATDSAWTENLSLLGYNFQIGCFTLPGLNTEVWFRDYLAIDDKPERIRRLNKLHFEMLIQASIVPTEVAPYYAVAKKPWKLNQSTLSSGTELWQMRLN